MKVLRVVAIMAIALGVAASGWTQQPGEVFGKVTDSSGATIPGVTVTLTSPVLLQPLVAVTSASGSYRFPGLAVGRYSVRFELPGFTALLRDGLRVEIGANLQINATLEISQMHETVTVSGQTPVVDLRDTSKTSRFTQEALQNLPSARDPWVIIEQAAGIAMDRQNVGGSASGQQSNFVARGAAMTQQKWNLDGVDITDMSATGGSPIYFDFDSFEEMQVSAGGADVTMQSPGVAVNLVTKSGTDQLKGSGRYYVTDQRFQSVNVDDDLRKQGAATGNPIQNIKDYGVEAGGPIRRGRAWFWGSASRQNVNVGVNNFYKSTPSCLAMKANPLAYSVSDIRDCLNPDQTILTNYNAKVAAEPFHNNQASLLFNAAEKVRNARDASDLRPLETTWRQMSVTRSDLGSGWWKTGMPKTYKWADRHIFSDRFMVEASYAHIGNNFALALHEDALRTVQPLYETTTTAWSRSYQEVVYLRPTDSVDVSGSYFLPGVLGGDHAIKFGAKYRNDIARTESMYGGDAIARTTNGAPSEAQIYRQGLSEYGLHNRSLYIQDTFSRKRLTLLAGARFDYQTDMANPASVAASRFYGQNTFAGTYNGVVYPGATFSQLPALRFAGAEAGVGLSNWSPRLGLTYDVQGNGQSVLKVNYARYVTQIGTGDMSSTYNTVALTYVRYPWVDLNGDRFIQANEIVMTPAPLSWTSGYSYANPTQVTTTGRVDPNISADRTDEILVSFDKQLGAEFAVSASYIWRKYGNVRANQLQFSAADWTPVQWTPTAGSCPAGASCPAVTYYQPTRQIPTDYVYGNVKDFWRGYQGLELAARKRMSKNWMMSASYSYNDAPMHFDSPEAYAWWATNYDPTGIQESLNGGQFAPESNSSGIGNVFVNQKWIVRMSGAYTLPWWKIGVAATYNGRSGNPFIRSELSPTRPFSAGTANVYLDKRGDVRLPTFQNVDLRVDKPITIIGRVKATVSMDVFNLLNANTALSIRGVQNATNANTISSLLSPRVVRFGIRATF